MSRIIEKYIHEYVHIFSISKKIILKFYYNDTLYKIHNIWFENEVIYLFKHIDASQLEEYKKIYLFGLILESFSYLPENFFSDAMIGFLYTFQSRYIKGYLNMFKYKESLSLFLLKIYKGSISRIEQYDFDNGSMHYGIINNTLSIFLKFLDENYTNINLNLINFKNLYDIKQIYETKFNEYEEVKDNIILLNKILFYNIFLQIKIKEEENIFLAILNINNINNDEEINSYFKE